MLRALILICSAASAPQVSDCTRERAFDVMVTKIERGSPITCFLQAQAYLAESAIGASLTPDDRVRIVCRPISPAE